MRKIALFSLFISAFIAKSFAGTLDETALKILMSSPEFKSEIYSLDASQSNLDTEANLPDPELGGEYLWMPEDVDNRWSLQLTWGLEWPGVYGARSKEAKAKMNVLQKAVYAQRMERLAEIKDLLLDYIRCQQKLALLEELTQNNDTIYRLAEEAARGGEMTVLDLNKVRLEYANIRVAKASLLDERSEVIAALSKICGKDCMDLLSCLECKFPEIVLPTPEQMAYIKENAPAVQAALAEVEAANKSRKVSRMEALPSISLGYKHAFEDAMHFNGVVWGLSIPVFSSHGKQKAAKADIMEAEIKAEAASAEIESEASAALKRLKMIVTQIEEIAPIVENADYNSALLKAYKGGVITLIEYISDRNYFTNAAVELVSLRHNAAKTLAFLQRYLDTAPGNGLIL